ncbi:DUF6339 family protein [Amycolatopsis australiensis]|uniref:Uncharacterized protein n=1 Tax=Amycolatopsis australiensis TaxID=546364 RepID=A0A1K1Q5B1_9PSEU|nr:DUF6339 family protein [Amycolatopsis australiensis]SFW54873.1 hypothetical protein SAMN04489730_1363 [Amycolatopsis australiensis]
MSPTAVDFPDVLGLLSDAAVTKHLSRSIQSGQEIPPRAALSRAAVMLPENETRWSVGPVRALVDEAMKRFEDSRARADAWLAPRLHATLRMTRAEAADSRLWNYLAMLVAPDYVVWRHGTSGLTRAARFSGSHFLQAFARLWWAAELFRDGADYQPVTSAFAYQDVVNSVMRLDVIDHRPTAAAIIRIVERLASEQVKNASDQINALSRAVNTAGSTLIFDVLAPDEPADNDALRDWIADSEHVPEVPWDRLPDGPADGTVARDSVDALVSLFEVLLAEAPRRDRSKKANDDSAEVSTTAH